MHATTSALSSSTAAMPASAAQAAGPEREDQLLLKVNGYFQAQLLQLILNGEKFTANVQASRTNREQQKEALAAKEVQFPAKTKALFALMTEMFSKIFIQTIPTQDPAIIKLGVQMTIVDDMPRHTDAINQLFPRYLEDVLAVQDKLEFTSRAGELTAKLCSEDSAILSKLKQALLGQTTRDQLDPKPQIVQDVFQFVDSLPDNLKASITEAVIAGISRALASRRG